MDIKKPNLAALLAKLSFLRNNLALLAPICLALVAGLMFIPTELLSAGLQKKMQTDSINKANELRSLLKTAVPTATIEIVRQEQQAYVEDVNAILALSQQGVQRALLSYKIFPEPKDSSSLIFEQFGHNYTEGVDRMIGSVNAKECPTDAELSQGGGDRSRGGRSGRGDRQNMMMMEELYGRGGGMMGPGYVADNSQSEIEDAICLEKAQSASVYVTLADVAGYDFWKTYTFDGDTAYAVEDCWYWQLGYWVVEDAFAVVRACNRGSATVLTSPVKRIRRVSFEKARRSMYGSSAGLYGGGGRSAAPARTAQGKDNSLPKYVLSQKEAMATPCTGRFSNETRDIVHFDLSVVVRADYVLPFMTELCAAKAHRFYGFDGRGPEQTLKHNPITILESRILPVVRNDVSHNLYRYGEDAVVELDLICEYLLDKRGYEAIYPTVVKDSFDQENL